MINIKAMYIETIEPNKMEAKLFPKIEVKRVFLGICNMKNNNINNTEII